MLLLLSSQDWCQHDRNDPHQDWARVSYLCNRDPGEEQCGETDLVNTNILETWPHTTCLFLDKKTTFITRGVTRLTYLRHSKTLFMRTCQDTAGTWLESFSDSSSSWPATFFSSTDHQKTTGWSVSIKSSSCSNTVCQVLPGSLADCLHDHHHWSRHPRHLPRHHLVRHPLHHPKSHLRGSAPNYIRHLSHLLVIFCFKIFIFF